MRHAILAAACALALGAGAAAAQDDAPLRPFGGADADDATTQTRPPPPGPPPPPTAPPSGPPPAPEPVQGLEVIIAGGEEGPTLPDMGVPWPYAPYRARTGPDGTAAITLEESGTYLIGVGADAALQPWGGVMVVRVGGRTLMAPALYCAAPNGMACPVLWLTAEAGEEVEMTVETVVIQMMTRPEL